MSDAKQQGDHARIHAEWHRAASQRDGSEFARDSFPAFGSRGKEILSPKAASAPPLVALTSVRADVNSGHANAHRINPVPLVPHVELVAENSADEIYRTAGGGRGAAARGESRADEFVAGYGGISTGGVSGSAPSASAAAIAQAVLAPDPGMARKRRGEGA